MSQTWTLGSRVSRRESRTTQRRKVRSTCSEIWREPKRVLHCRRAHGTKTFYSRRFLDNRRSGEVLWDTFAQEGLAGKQQLDNWCTLLAEHGLQVEWSQEKPESASGIGGVTRPIGVVYVPVGLAGCIGIFRFTVVEQDVPPLLPVLLLRTLQASLDLNDDGDKVIFRQFGGESPLLTLQSGHSVIRADQFDPDGWHLPEISELCPDHDKGRTTNCMSVIAHVYQRPRCMDDDTPAGGHDPAPTRICRPRQKTTRDEEQEEQCCESSGDLSGCAAKPHREATVEPRERRRRTTATIHRMPFRRDATLRCATNDARCVGNGGSAFP